jgi:hypothetical protein
LPENSVIGEGMKIYFVVQFIILITSHLSLGFLIYVTSLGRPSLDFQATLDIPRLLYTSFTILGTPVILGLLSIFPARI